MPQILQARHQWYTNWEAPDVQARFKKAEESEKTALIETWKKQRNSRKNLLSVTLTILKPLIVWITTNWKVLKETETPDHLTCLLRNLYAGQKTTVRTRHGTMDWFKIGKGVHQCSILSSCLFNIMQNAGWMNHKPEWRLPGEISTTSDMQMITL